MKHCPHCQGDMEKSGLGELVCANCNYSVNQKIVEISISLDRPVFEWLEAQIKNGTFHNRRHGIEFALARLKTQWEKAEKSLQGGR